MHMPSNKLQIVMINTAFMGSEYSATVVKTAEMCEPHG
jgi:hypothetical protein